MRSKESMRCADPLKQTTQGKGSSLSTMSLLAQGLAAFWVDSSKDVLPNYGWKSWALCIARSLRVALNLRTTIRILSTETYQTYGRGALARPLVHQLFSRHYLRKNLSPKYRGQLALEHTKFERTSFDCEYFKAIYEDHGLNLWTHDTEHATFRIVLRLGGRSVPEGDLRISLLVNDEPLSQIGFTWVRSGDGMVPFIARNQSRWRQDRWVLEAFEKAFPQNSSMLFTYAALQGLARTVKSKCILAVRTVDQIVYKASEPKSFANSYDGFWEKLGGCNTEGLGFSIPIPFHVTPLEEVASKHRKRAIRRRENWQAIEKSTIQQMSAHLNRPHPIYVDELDGDLITS